MKFVVLFPFFARNVIKRCGNMFIELILQCIALFLTHHNLVAGFSSEMGKVLVCNVCYVAKFELYRIKNAEIVPECQTLTRCAVVAITISLFRKLTRKMLKLFAL